MPARWNAVRNQNAARIASSVSTRVGTVPIRHRRHTRSANATTASGRPQARVTGSSPIIGPASPASALNVAAAESATKPGASVSSRRTDSVS